MTFRDGRALAPAPFVVGSPRSGTTLLRAMLDAHPAVAVPGESHFIPRMRAARRRYERGGGLDVPRYCADLERDRYFSAWGLPASDVQGFLELAEAGTIEDAIRGTFTCYARSQGKSRWGDKTPAYVLHMPAIATMFPEARFIHVIRDGRDVARSLLDLGWASSIEDAALRWAYRVRRGRRAGARSGARYLEIHYEDLLSATVPSLELICSFLDLRFDERMAQPERRAASVLATLTHPENHQRLTLPPSRVRNWREDLSLDQVTRFEAVAGELLESVGYERAGRNAGLSTRFSVKARSFASLPQRMSARLRRTVALK